MRWWWDDDDDGDGDDDADDDDCEIGDDEDDKAEDEMEDEKVEDDNIEKEEDNNEEDDEKNNIILWKIRWKIIILKIMRLRKIDPKIGTPFLYIFVRNCVDEIYMNYFIRFCTEIYRKNAVS